MARPESRALGGFFATPPHLVPSIAALVGVCGEVYDFAVMDPCAGDGAAVIALTKLLAAKANVPAARASVYAVELEAKRARDLARNGKAFGEHRFHALHGDAFRVKWSLTDDCRNTSNGVTVAFENPPYDERGQLETRFLDRFTPAIAEHGVLIYVVPHASLAVGASILARFYRNLHCFRFPDPDFAAFKQVVLVGKKHSDLLAPDPALVAQLEAWAAHPEAIPVLPANGPAVVEFAPQYNPGFRSWTMAPTETRALLAAMRPWSMTTRTGERRSIPGIMPEPGEDLLRKVYPLASVPKPAHVSAALAADVYSGERILPTDPSSGLPPIMVKGVFDKVRKETEQRTNKDGEVTGRVTIEQPRLAVTALDLVGRKTHTIRNAVEVSGSRDLATMTMGDLLEHYGPSLLAAMFENCPVLHDPARPEDRIPLPATARKLFEAQSHAAMTCIKLLRAEEKTGVLLGQIGVGKTSVGLVAARGIDARSTLVMCPPSLLQSWRDQAAAVFPGMDVVTLDNLAAVDALAFDVATSTPIDGRLAILSREGAKLGHAWQGIGSTALLPLTAWGEGEETGPAWLAGGRAPREFTLTVAKLATGSVLDLVIETSEDGNAWRSVVTLTAKRSGAQPFTVEGADRWLRARWTASSEITFGVELNGPARAVLCPSCGARVQASPEELARTRARCTATTRRPGMVKIKVGDTTIRRTCPLARAAREVAFVLLPVLPGDPRVTQVLDGRHEQRVAATLAARWDGPEREAASVVGWDLRRDAARPALERVLATTLAAYRAHCLDDSATDDDARGLADAVMGLLVGLGDLALVERTARALYTGSTTLGEEHDHVGSYFREMAREILLLLPPGGDAQRRAEVSLRALGKNDDGYAGIHSSAAPWTRWEKRRDRLDPAIPEPEPSYSYGYSYGRALSTTVVDGTFTYKEGVRWNGVALGSVEAIARALATLTGLGAWTTSAECGERLYQAVPVPRRYPLAKYITKRHRRLFDCLLIDEAHQYASTTSAQSFAAHRLLQLKLPSLLLTGSIMGGLAEHLFVNQWRVDRRFREDFALDEQARFVEQYGFLRELDEDRDTKTGAVVAYGSMTDRVDRKTRTLGCAPGVLPLFLLKYLLRVAVTLHRQDLAVELPPCREIAVPVTPLPHQSAGAESLKKALLRNLKADRGTARAGQLLGQLARLPAYLDCATDDCGNGPGGSFEVSYPAPPSAIKVARGRGKAAEKPRGAVVATVEAIPRETLLPKEERLLAIVRAELAEGRPCTVFAWHQPVLARLNRILTAELGEPVAFLQASKVAAADRQDWIDREVIAKGVRVLLVQPVAVGVGLNNLVWFPTAIWFENPACDAIIRRQADGRFDRLGKTLETRIYSLFYEGTLQAHLYELLMHKVGVSLATDGLDAAGALEAAGVGERDSFSDAAIGQVIYAMLAGDYKAPRTSKAAVSFGAVMA